MNKPPASGDSEGRREQLDGFREKLVRVQSADGHRFEGRLAGVFGEEPSVILRNATELPGEVRFPRVFLRKIDWIVEKTADG